ncbi:hypothetical protein UA08_02548 [Talaromyces atroroseus]|uniref:Mid2 domain-containing protein n=1 Tax=Talaromyces atroroseus TaxID=1441469 RepID=A0A225AM69_TALAT|nr:hypothetical protein UA08_02548 [Talaromyces atroroseus]OKL61990.1 hypothetical protein UA08_02548 [Talaromyces atroroseus]
MWLRLLLLAVAQTTTVRAEGFTFPTDQEDEFIVGDLVNVTWDVVTARFSLYESCETAVALESNSTNNYSYIWNATRANYRESGCVFKLEPLDADGVANPPNLTSVYFGVNKRYSTDPAPTYYNFGGSLTNSSSTSSASSSSTSSPTSVSISTSIPVATTATGTSTPTPSSSSTHTSALTTAQKVGLGVGIPLGILTLCSVGILFMWYRRRIQYQRTCQVQNDAMEEGKASFKPASYSHNRVASGTETLVSELSAQNYDVGSGGSRPISELMGTPRAEME